MMERKSVLTAVVLLGLFCAAVAQAEELYIPTSFGMGADTYVANTPGRDYWAVDDNFGGEARMRLRYNGGGSRFFAAYLRFDISSMTEPFGADTRLQMTTSWLKTDQGSRTLYIYGLTDDDTDDNWVEGDGVQGTQVTDPTFITYANAPGMIYPGEGDAYVNTGNYAIDPAKLTLLGTIATPAQVGAYTNPVTFWSAPSAALVDFLNADGNGLVTLVIIERDGTSGTNNEGEFQTKENSLGSPPALVPEPATLMLLGLGSLMFARGKRS